MDEGAKTRLRKAPMFAFLLVGMIAAVISFFDPEARAGVPPPRRVSVIRDVNYERVGSTKLNLNVFLPAGRGPFPGIVYIHGGKFDTGDKCQPLTAASAYHLASLGFVVYSIDYRLAPRLVGVPTRLRCANGSTIDVSALQGHHFPAAANDAAAAVRWVKENGSRYKTDTSRVSCVGSSAGGTLCYGLGARGLVDVQVGWSGPTKLDVGFARSVSSNYIGCRLAGGPVQRLRGLVIPVSVWAAADVILAAIWLLIRRRRGIA